MKSAVYLALLGVGVSAYPQQRSQAQELLEELGGAEQIYVEHDGQAFAVESKYELDGDVLYVVTIDGTGKIVTAEQVKERKLNTIAYEDDIEPVGLTLKDVAKITENIPTTNIEIVKNVVYEGKIIIGVKRFELSNGGIYYLVTGAGGQEVGYVSVDDVTEEDTDINQYILNIQRETELPQSTEESEDDVDTTNTTEQVTETVDEADTQVTEEQESEEQESEEQESDEQESEEQESEEAVTEESVSEEQATEEQASEEQVTEESVSEEQATEEQESEEQTSGYDDEVEVTIKDFTEYNYQLVQLKGLEEQEVIHPELDRTHVVEATNSAGNPYNFVLRGEGESNGVTYASLYKDGEFLGYINKGLTEPKPIPEENISTTLTMNEVSERYGIPLDKLMWLNEGIKDPETPLDRHMIQLKERKDVLFVNLLAEEGTLPDVNDTNTQTINYTKK